MTGQHGRRRTPATPHPAYTAALERGVGEADAVLSRLRHELRTPINAIIGYGEMILDEADDHSHPDLFSDLEGVIAQGRTLLALLNRALYTSDRSGVVALQAHSIFIGPLRDEFDSSTLAILDTCEWLQRAAAKVGDESLDADLRKIAMAAAKVRAIVADVQGPPTPPEGSVLIDDIDLGDSAFAARPRSSGEAGRILVVDDQAINRELLTRRLEQDGYVVQSAGTGRAALDRMRSESFDLILLDVMMPGATGFEVLSRLKSDPRTRHIPVLMISALDEMQSVVRGIEMGADDYLTTPIDPILLRARVSSSLERKRMHDDEMAFIDAIRRDTDSSHDGEGILPRELPRVRGLEMASLFLPAPTQSGDFHEVVRLTGERVGVVLAHVRSTAADTRLFIALTRSVLASFAERLASGMRVDPLDVVLRINGYVRSELTSTTASLVFAVIDPRSGTVHYVNAGHSPPVILGPDGIRTVLIPTGPAIGAASDGAFARETTELTPGDCLLIHSDGVIEVQNGNGAIFSEQRLHELLSNGTHLASALVARVEDGVREFMGALPNGDDITVLAIRRERRD